MLAIIGHQWHYACVTVAELSPTEIVYMRWERGEKDAEEIVARDLVAGGYGHLTVETLPGHLIVADVDGDTFAKVFRALKLPGY